MYYIYIWARTEYIFVSSCRFLCLCFVFCKMGWECRYFIRMSGAVCLFMWSIIGENGSQDSSLRNPIIMFSRRDCESDLPIAIFLLLGQIFGVCYKSKSCDYFYFKIYLPTLLVSKMKSLYQHQNSGLT